jgi:hypothetical protein
MWLLNSLVCHTAPGAQPISNTATLQRSLSSSNLRYPKKRTHYTMCRYARKTEFSDARFWHNFDSFLTEL